MCRRPLEFATRIDGVLEEIPEVAHWLDEIAASNCLAEPVAFALQVCAEELLSNIVRHGGRRVAAGPSGKRSQTTLVNVSVKVSIEPTTVRLTVEDDGKPFDVAAAEAHRMPTRLDRQFDVLYRRDARR